MTDQTQQPTRLSEKVTTKSLDIMYNNFVKITDWVVKGKESQYPLPKALAWLFDTAENSANEVAELKQTITSLQTENISLRQQLTSVEATLQGVNVSLKSVVDAVNAQHQQDPATFAPQTQNPVVPEPVAPQPTPVVVVDELVDLDDVASEPAVAQHAPVAPQPAVSPNEQAIQVSAEAVGAGNLDPVSYQALDAELNNLLGQ